MVEVEIPRGVVWEGVGMNATLVTREYIAGPFQSETCSKRKDLGHLHMKEGLRIPGIAVVCNLFLALDSSGTRYRINS